jgi:hypothetical protein
MRIVFHLIIGVIIFVLVSAHLLVICLFIFCPTPILLNAALPHDVEYMNLTKIPEHVIQVFSDDQPVDLYADNNPVHQIASKILMTKERKFFSENEKRELYLNALNFGGNVIGIESASEYYFKKPVSDLNFEETLTLAGLYRIFKN